MSTSDTIAVVSAISAIAAAAVAVFAWGSARKTLLHQTLVDIQNDYRSPEMLFAVRTLWEFYRHHGPEKFVEEYERERAEESEWVSQQAKKDRIEFEKATLHFQRRLVSHFYQHLAALYVNKVLPKRILYGIWSESDLRIIPEVLIPIENKLRQVFFQQAVSPLDENCSLMVLYRDSKTC